MNKCLLVLPLCILLLVHLVEAAPQGSLITQLPGFNGKFLSNHYSGYISIDGNGENGKNLFYYFVSSERNPSKDPVVLWLNGGPGCSSFDGFVYEHGPFNFEAAKSKGKLPTLHNNPYSWSKVSNIIYLDSPTGVGLSYSKNITNYSTGDLQTASDTHAFLLKWFEEFPEFQANPFYVSGESYAGIYVPTLAYEIAKGIRSLIKPVINLKGYLVGNGVTDQTFDDNAFIPFVHGMGLISDTIYEAVGDLNMYNILEPCYHDPEVARNKSSNLPLSFQNLGKTERPLSVRKRMFGRAWPFRAPVRDGPVTLWPQLMADLGHVPCVASNRWELCTDRISYEHDAGSMIPYHKNLTRLGYRALIFSGDHDMCVPFTGSEAWTRSLGYKIVDEWRPWDSNEQVA
ncbi:hypothetical protein TSUD_158240, partial [Trifolium subterraneum]